jgi:hypothetical protein
MTRQEIEQQMDELAREFAATHDPEIPEEILNWLGGLERWTIDEPKLNNSPQIAPTITERVAPHLSSPGLVRLLSNRDWKSTPPCPAINEPGPFILPGLQELFPGNGESPARRGRPTFLRSCHPRTEKALAMSIR